MDLYPCLYAFLDKACMAEIVSVGLNLIICVGLNLLFLLWISHVSLLL
jgi:hypothetical protein